MRIRAVVAILLLLPAPLSAQRFPVPRTGRDPARPVPLPRQPEPIARELAYRRLRLSVESYPLISYVQSPGLAADGRTSAWTTFGAGTRAEYRLTRHASATLDLTSSLVGSPLIVQTAELGTRLRPERTERRVYPFADLRVGFVSAYDRSLGPILYDAAGFPTPQSAYGIRYSNGFGGVAGAGMEYALTRTFSLTTGASVMVSRLTSHDFRGSQTVDPGFAMTSYRLTIGVRYNPVRLVMPSGGDRR
ncbi:MAG TPA: hypothetical protein VFN38_12820 [Gemmatimonadaceae bacterium]|nr:hypothetical protein [Gemmatimonadaceae bacterium]